MLDRLSSQLIALVVGLIGLNLVQAADLVLSPDEALAKARAGELTLIDIRTPPEWRETGVPVGAKRLDMTDPRFLDRLLELIKGDKSAPIALICRTGNRSGYVVQQLQRLGFSQIYDIPEGMAGSRAGPGWLRRGLPIEKQ
ncbi:rhodanese-like domain-containing protein [Caldichromatium japonicum]|uniref:Rhodanese-like domain-containing protein n=1 Tax=Caldichromatium japonicum TaxID=2699430 RepID=A0A6G7VAE9_9GAMM|nr:rhodanese-like domain-containing protein [Caldichromatium japonicum]QIK36845.1 rhodanese-like domain-containing protein [Caldichromatium japonicum]